MIHYRNFMASLFLEKIDGVIDAAAWVSELGPRGSGSPKVAAAMLLDVLASRSQDFADGYGFDRLERTELPLGTMSPASHQRLPEVTAALALLAVRKNAAFHVLPEDFASKHALFVVRLYCRLLGLHAGESPSPGFHEEEVIAASCLELERVAARQNPLEAQERETWTVDTEWFDDMDALASHLASATEHAAMRRRLLEAGNSYVLWGARLLREDSDHFEP